MAVNASRVLTSAALARRSCSSNMADAMLAADGITAAGAAAAGADAGLAGVAGRCTGLDAVSFKCWAASAASSGVFPAGFSRDTRSWMAAAVSMDMPVGRNDSDLLVCILVLDWLRSFERAASNKADVSFCVAGCLPVVRNCVSGSFTC